MSQELHPRAGWRETLRVVIFGHDTPAGKAFDVALMIAIVMSVVAVALDSVSHIREQYGTILTAIEWGFTILFTIEYALRLLSAPRAGKYARSFFGVIDLMSIIPTYLSVIFPTSRYLLVIRVLRVLRVYRVLKLVEYLGEADVLMSALRESRKKISVFLLAVFALAVILGSMMYLIEGEGGGFTSIPRSVYWAIVTLTTVGYGDISPVTSMGQAFAAVIMMLGYSIIAVPTGIVTVELSRLGSGKSSTRGCRSCARVGHDADAIHCKFCGASL